MVNVIWWKRMARPGGKNRPSWWSCTPCEEGSVNRRSARQAKNQAIRELRCVDFIPMILGDIINFIPILLLKSQEPELCYCGWKKSWADRDGLSHSSPLFFLHFVSYLPRANNQDFCLPIHRITARISVFASFSTSIHRISKFLPPLTNSTLRCHFPATFDDMREYIP